MSGTGGTGEEKVPMSGAKGFAVIVGGMFGIMAVLWLIAALAAP